MSFFKLRLRQKTEIVMLLLFSVTWLASGAVMVGSVVSNESAGTEWKLSFIASGVYLLWRVATGYQHIIDGQDSLATSIGDVKTSLAEAAMIAGAAKTKVNGIEMQLPHEFPPKEFRDKIDKMEQNLNKKIDDLPCNTSKTILPESCKKSIDNSE